MNAVKYRYLLPLAALTIYFRGAYSITSYASERLMNGKLPSLLTQVTMNILHGITWYTHVNYDMGNWGLLAINAL